MKIHEFQAKNLLRKYGVETPDGCLIENPADVEEAYKQLGAGLVAVKSQIHAGGRGKGTLYDGEDPQTATMVQEGGVKTAQTGKEVSELVNRMLGAYLLTHQTGGKARHITRIYLEKGVAIASEFYLSILIDRSLSCPIIIASAAGGMNIEEVAASDPDKLIRMPVDPALGLQGWQAREILFRLGVPTSSIKDGISFLLRLWKCYKEEDCSLLEINPLSISTSGELCALDCKMDLDDNALFRHPDNELLRDIAEEDPLEREASTYGLNYIKLDGNVGCMVNGAGLAMATMDIIKLAGCEPANFLDVGGNANAESVANGFRIILSDTNVKAIFVNIFGGIVQCDRVANGIIQAAKDVHVHVPLIVRLKGTNAEKAREILAGSDLAIIVADELNDGAEKTSKAVNGAN